MLPQEVKAVLPTLWVLPAAALALYALCMRYDPKKPHARNLRHGVMGLMMLMMWNLLPLPHIGVNPLSAWLSGALGLPGVGLLAAISLLP